MNEKKKREEGAEKNQNKAKGESILTIKVDIMAINIHHIRIRGS